MRLTDDHQQTIRQLTAETFGSHARVRLFGSRVDDTARGGDVDLLVELDDPVAQPAVQASLLEVRLSRVFDGRKVDVVVLAPNLKRQPIHEVAQRQGVLL